MSHANNLGWVLANAGWVLYSRAGCGYCERQMAELGGAYPRAVHCSPASCANVTAFPTWVNTRTGERRVGLQGRAALLSMASGR
jgi:hypothetical protein